MRGGPRRADVWPVDLSFIDLCAPVYHFFAMATRPDPGAGGSTGVNIQALNNALNVFSSVVQQVATTATGQAPQNNA